MSHHEITVMLLSIGAMLLAARMLGELFRRFNQPSIIGEILAGIILGPTVFGTIAPEFFLELFPKEGPVAIFRSGISTLCVVLFLLAAGMEVDLSTIFRLRNAAVRIGLAGMLLPFSMGFFLAHWAPYVMGMEHGANKFVFALFLGTAMSISALPVIAKTLMDLKLYRSDLGMIVIASAIFHDIIGWVIFGIILGLMHPESHGGMVNVASMVVLTVGFAAVMLTAGRPVIDRTLP